MVKIVVQPQDFKGNAGETAYFSCYATGTTLSYRWQFRTPGTTTWQYSSAASAQTPTVDVAITARRLGQSYRCVVTDLSDDTVEISDVGTIIGPVPVPSDTFDIKLQTNNSEATHVTKDLTDLKTFSGLLRDDCSIVDPIIMFEEPITSFAAANYLTIESFGRSYFITDIISVTSELTEVHAHVDVLSSFADEIKANNGIVLRQANDWNLYLADDVVRCYANPIVHTMAFPSGFSGESYVLLVAGRRDAGIDVGQGGMASGTGIDGGGTGNTGSKTTSGLYAYAYAQLAKPYWWGTFGQTSDATLLSARRAQYPDNYDTSVVGGEAFEDQYGQRVHDCVGLVKGYRWSDTPTSAPVYNASQDVNVQGLYSQCTRIRGTIDRSDLSGIPVGAVLFYGSMEHCGVYAGSGNIIEARGHAYGVVQTTLTVRTGFTLWGVPDWMQVG